MISLNALTCKVSQNKVIKKRMMSKTETGTIYLT